MVRISFSNLFKEFKSTATWLQFPFVCTAAKGSLDEGTARASRRGKELGLGWRDAAEGNGECRSQLEGREEGEHPGGVGAVSWPGAPCAASGWVCGCRAARLSVFLSVPEPSAVSASREMSSLVSHLRSFGADRLSLVGIESDNQCLPERALGFSSFPHAAEGPRGAQRFRLRGQKAKRAERGLLPLAGSARHQR